MRQRASPNWNDRPAGAAVDLLLLHYTGMVSAEAAVARLCDPAAEVSAHYVVLEHGGILTLVPEAKRAWHAGVSHWQGRDNLNDVAIGIEIVNTGHAHGLRPFPDRQMAAVVELAGDIVRRWRIPPDRVVGHSDVAPERKLDPGERFDWPRLARAGIGSWPEEPAPARPDPRHAQALLRLIGYRPAGGKADFAVLLAAFQRRFRPWRIDGRLDAATMSWLIAIGDLLARR